MKKLMTMVAAATMAFGLFADDFADNNVEFDTAELGLYDFPEQYGELYWDVPAEGVEGTVTAGDEVQYLKLEAETPVYRTFANRKGAAGMVPVDIAAEGRGGIIAEQKVQFTAFDNETETPDNLGDAKIAVWVKADPDDETKGTLMVTTKALDNDSFKPVVEYTNHNTGKEIILADWYQLTIRAYPVADQSTEQLVQIVPGFKIELDGDVITAPDIWPSISTWGDVYTFPQSKKLVEENKLFPSMIAFDAGAGANTLVGVGFKGTGSIESINIAGEAPPAPTTFEITANSSENGEYTVTVADEEVEAAVAGDTVTITATPNTGYELATITVTDAEEVDVVVVVEGNVGTFTMPAKAVTVEVTFKPVPTDPIPPVNPDATPTEVNEAVDAANFADTTVKPMIGGDATKYIAFKKWADTVNGGEEAVVASLFAAKSFELSDVVLAPKLFTAAPTVEITAAADATDGVSFNVQLKEDDDPVAVKEAIANSVKVGINLETWDAIDSELVKLSDDAKTVTVTMPEEEGGKCFMKVVITK